MDRIGDWRDSEPEINIVGITVDGESYEVVLPISYHQWIFFFEKKVNLNYDPTVPREKDVLVYGVIEATAVRAERNFLRQAAHKIHSGCSRVYEVLCRDLDLSRDLARPLEKAILSRDILVNSSRSDTQSLLMLPRNVTHQLASALHNTLCSSA